MEEIPLPCRNLLTNTRHFSDPQSVITLFTVPLFHRTRLAKFSLHLNYPSQWPLKNTIIPRLYDELQRKNQIC